MPESKQPKRYAPADLDNSNIAAGAGIASSKLADGANFINRNGSVAFTGNQSMGGQKITNLGTPAAASTDAARIIDVENAVANAIAPFTARETVRVATTVNITLSGTQIVNGVAVAVGERVLVKDQTLPAENGVYVVAAGAWTRAIDMDTWAEIPGSWITVQEGTVGADTVWLASANQGGTLGTTAVTFINPFSGLGAGLNTSNFVFDETPSGTVNGVNTTFTLANTPTAGTVRLHINGYRLLVGAGNDFTISSGTITMLTAPLTGEILKVDYMRP